MTAPVPMRYGACMLHATASGATPAASANACRCASITALQLRIVHSAAASASSVPHAATVPSAAAARQIAASECGGHAVKSPPHGSAVSTDSMVSGANSCCVAGAGAGGRCEVGGGAAARGGQPAGPGVREEVPGGGGEEPPESDGRSEGVAASWGGGEGAPAAAHRAGGERGGRGSR